MIRRLLIKTRTNLRKAFLPDRFYTSEHLDEKQFAKLGKFTYGNPNVFNSEDGGKLSIGNFCSIAGNVTILLGGNHRTDWITTYPFPASPDFASQAKGISSYSRSKGDVTIGNDVQIGHGVIILSGVTIGDGAVVGAGSVVTRDVAPYSIVAGNPATVIRKRFSQSIIKKLLKIKWWEWDEIKIKQNIEKLCNDSVNNLR